MRIGYARVSTDDQTLDLQRDAHLIEFRNATKRAKNVPVFETRRDTGLIKIVQLDQPHTLFSRQVTLWRAYYCVC
jgi:predicted site-specific integrase-resolvase